MAKKKSKLSPQRAKFKKAQAKCHKESDTRKDFGACMSKELKGKKSKSKKKKK